jgi:hypothetical protein
LPAAACRSRMRAPRHQGSRRASAGYERLAQRSADQPHPGGAADVAPPSSSTSPSTGDVERWAPARAMRASARRADGAPACGDRRAARAVLEPTVSPAASVVMGYAGTSSRYPAVLLDQRLTGRDGSPASPALVRAAAEACWRVPRDDRRDEEVRTGAGLTGSPLGPPAALHRVPACPHPPVPESPGIVMCRWPPSRPPPRSRARVAARTDQAAGGISRVSTSRLPRPVTSRSAGDCGRPAGPPAISTRAGTPGGGRAVAAP